MISEAKKPVLSESANRFSKFFDPKEIFIWFFVVIWFRKRKNKKKLYIFFRDEIHYYLKLFIFTTGIITNKHKISIQHPQKHTKCVFASKTLFYWKYLVWRPFWIRHIFFLMQEFRTSNFKYQISILKKHKKNIFAYFFNFFINLKFLSAILNLTFLKTLISCHESPRVILITKLDHSVFISCIFYS